MSILPLRRTIARSYGFAIRHFPLLVRVGWLWFLLAYAGAILAPVLAAEAGLPAVAYLGEAIMMAAGTAVLVAWHRAIAEGDGMRRTALFGSREARYLGIGLAMLVVLYVPVVAMMVVTQISAEPPKAAVTVLSAGFLLVAISINRLILIFPAIAIGLRQFGLKQSWTLTTGNTWRLFLGVIACSGPPLVITAGLTAAADIAHGRGAAWFVIRPLEFLGFVALFGQLAVVGGFLSFVFAHFVGSGAPLSGSRPPEPESAAPEPEPAAKVA